VPRIDTHNRIHSPRIQERRDLKRYTKIIDDNGQEITLSFDDLEFGKLLGRGQFGVVKKCTHKPTGMELAAKIIAMTTENEDQKNELMDLDVPMKTGHCTFTVRFYGALFAEGCIWVLTECMDASLDKFYAKAFAMNETITELFMSKIASSVLQGLAYLKSKNIMHRDVKPSNILINKKGEIKLCDFGISGVMNNSRCQTMERGCRPYMAPEKINPNLESQSGYSVKADIWSLGISLIEVATGQHPYHEASDFLSQIRAVVECTSPELDKSKFSPEFCGFVKSCLHKEADFRGTLDMLLCEKFITMHANEQLDFEFVQRVIDSVKADNIE